MIKCCLVILALPFGLVVLFVNHLALDQQILHSVESNNIGIVSFSELTLGSGQSTQSLLASLLHFFALLLNFSKQVCAVVDYDDVANFASLNLSGLIRCILHVVSDASRGRSVPDVIIELFDDPLDVLQSILILLVLLLIHLLVPGELYCLQGKLCSILVELIRIAVVVSLQMLQLVFRQYLRVIVQLVVRLDEVSLQRSVFVQQLLPISLLFGLPEYFELLLSPSSPLKALPFLLLDY